MGKNFFTEGILGFKWGRSGFFSKPSVVEVNWSVGDNAKKDSKQSIGGKADGEKFKCDIKIKL